MDIGLIASPLIKTKKMQDRMFPFAASLNYGLLSLATHLVNQGFSAKVFDPREWRGGKAVQQTLAWIREHQPQFVAISCISGFSYPAFKILVREVRKTFPDIPIIAGGKDHLALIAERAMKECPEIDVLVKGEGELPLVAIMERGLTVSNTENLRGIPNVILRDNLLNTGTISHDDLVEFDSFLPLDFTLHENFILHPPSIEVGRGCPFKCSFCPNDRKKILKKDPGDIVKEAKKLSALYNTKKLLMYFQTPMFLMSDKELSKLKALRNAMGLSFEWRTQTRVDYLSPEKIELIGQAGGRVVDLGLESGSEEMLGAMCKTENPAKYLSAASDILHAAERSRVAIKLNILFYAGERRKTLLETFDFLEKHAGLKWTLSAYPLLIYPGTLLESSIEPMLKKYGGSVVQTYEWQEQHLIPVNPSEEFSYQEMQRLGILFGKAFQTSDEYFNERRYGYYRPGVTYGEFLKHAEHIGFEDLPCSIDKEDMLLNRRTLKSILENTYANCTDWR
ncbi:MAG: B12-binding domain-containing radical SAM protein [Desulfuromonadales bacterium]|nr:B12-binding domain-containing radical SAM protein [Desulfuromonadales bacterium]